MSSDLGSVFGNIHTGLTTILDPLGLTPMAAEAVGIDVGSLPGFSKPQQASTFAAKKKKAMPTPPTKDDEQAMLARRKEMARLASRGGRASTILTSADERLG